ncbi:MAG: hypothetical protein Q8888_02620 [Vigna little leaf phytoplasma]|nr:hypothetical protein [Vigna little leaf phytoplasma]
MDHQIKWFCVGSWMGYLLVFLLFWGHRNRAAKIDVALPLPPLPTVNVKTPTENLKTPTTTKPFLSATFQPASREIDAFYYHSLLPQKTGQVGPLALYDVYLGAYCTAP